MSKQVFKKISKAILGNKYTKEEKKKLLRWYEKNYVQAPDWKKEAVETFDGKLPFENE